MNTAYWDLEDHAMAMGGLGPLDGAIGGVQPGLSVIVDPPDGKIPYQPWALEERKKKFEVRRKVDPFDRALGDPEYKCYMAGIPRSTYMNQPFQIIQSPRYVVMAYQYANTNRSIRMGIKPEAPVDSWMGWSTGNWEGETLVVETTGLNGLSWLDRAGNFGSDKLAVVERFTLTGPDHMDYQATLTDPTVYTRPWRIQMPLYRLKHRYAQLLEYRCVELTEELIYGPLVKPGAPRKTS
jgi:hypothetical protein